jgi:DNA-binding NarL/FixJ family response regulator
LNIDVPPEDEANAAILLAGSFGFNQYRRSKVAGSPEQLRAQMKILLADDHALFRAGVLHVLRQLGDSTNVIEAGNWTDVRQAIDTNSDLSLALLDLNMPGADGCAALRSIVQQRRTLPVVVLSASEKRDDMQQVLDAGALGFIPKTATPAVILSALRLVLAGGVYVPPEMIRSSESEISSPDRTTSGLTPRQLEVLARVVEGKSNKAIARELGLTEGTVKAHVTAAFRVLKVNNRVQAARAMETLKLEAPSRSGDAEPG